jgi:hypothetical protein
LPGAGVCFGELLQSFQPRFDIADFGVPQSLLQDCARGAFDRERMMNPR